MQNPQQITLETGNLPSAGIAIYFDKYEMNSERVFSDLKPTFSTKSILSKKLIDQNLLEQILDFTPETLSNDQKLEIATALLEGTGVPSNAKLGLRLLEEMAEADVSEAFSVLVNYYFNNAPQKAYFYAMKLGKANQRSRNQVKETVKLQRGLHLYKTGQSKYWYVRILIPRTEKFIRKSTKETNRIDAGKVAYELFQDFMTQPTKYAKIDAPNSFKIYAEKLIEKQRREVKTGAKSARFLSDDLKIINREDDGLLIYFRDYPIDEITTSAMRQYFDLLDDNRDKPLASSTKNKHGVILSKTFKMAAEFDAIKEIPLIPNFSVTDVNAGPKLHRTPERKCTIWLDLAGVKLRQLVGFRFVHGPARRSAPTKQRSFAGLWSNRGAVFALQALRDCRLCLRR